MVVISLLDKIGFRINITSTEENDYVMLKGQLFKKTTFLIINAYNNRTSLYVKQKLKTESTTKKSRQIQLNISTSHFNINRRVDRKPVRL